ncbi:MAG TPA: TatD family hydrolase [Gammaproteobacteria bacterium]|jgi:TatD DNase family protein|nr:TatD family hydrolase [Gammaproteobacteria bacterium]
MFLVDSHCHLNLLSRNGEDVTAVVERAQQNGVGYLLNVCVSLADFTALLETAKAYDCVGASVGLHPNEREEETDCAQLVRLAQDTKVVAIGETGLDYFRSEGDVEWQRERFRNHIRAAKTVGKPLIIHTRAAQADTLRIMQEEGAQDIGGVMHCFTENWDIAKACLAMNFHISFSGIVTFKNTQDLQEVAEKVPLDRMLIETDAPYLAPNPHRGKPNEPAFVRYTAAYLAALRGMTEEKLATQTTENFFALFTGAQRPDV